MDEADVTLEELLQGLEEERIAIWKENNPDAQDLR